MDFGTFDGRWKIRFYYTRSESLYGTKQIFVNKDDLFSTLVVEGYLEVYTKKSGLSDSCCMVFNID